MSSTAQLFAGLIAFLPPDQHKKSAPDPVISTCLQDCRNCFIVILSGDNRVKNNDSPYHSAQIDNHDCFHKADHVSEIQGSDGW